ncbi:hypothetical protein NQ314_013057 [Rhamnusium bicolor]|uniref:Uncharacterized protein n=1 Tax=Rhamnusium bicolor TaxID=1586634 RepID=A0AAV8X8N1_9CUCU|nr:hypothetical protein NQ314_013057 [Rhamnusium bicolor]
MKLLPTTKRFKNAQLERDIFKNSEGLEARIKHMQIGRSSEPMFQLLAKAREREASKYEDKSEPQSWLSKILTSQPDV